MPWTGIAFHGLYKGVLRDLILRLKFDGQLHLARALGTLLLNASGCLSAPDALVPVPQHDSRLRKRGYNQAHELAREVALQGRLPFCPQMLRRTTQQKAQEGLSALERRLNLQQAFQGNQAAAGAHIWLIDDVFTSGSTARAAAALLHAGARSVQLLFVARTDFS